MSALKFEVYSLDCLGNDDDGYEVNDRCHIGTIRLETEFTDQDLIQELIEAEILNGFSGQIKNVFTIDYLDENSIQINKKHSGKPLLDLERVK